MANDVIDNAVDFLEKIRKEDEVTIKFIKKNGDERVMKCTLNFDKIPSRHKPKDVSIANIMKNIRIHKLVNVYDLEKNDWRSVPFDRAEWLETPSNNLRYTIKS